MSIDIRDIQNIRGNISTYKDFDILADWLEKYGLDLSKEFSEQGYTEFPQELVLEIEMAKNYSLEYWLNPELREVVDDFISILEKCKNVAIASETSI